MTSPRLCGGMLVAMPTAMPPAPLTSRLGNCAGRTDGSRSRPVVIGDEVDCVLVEVAEQRVGDLGQPRLGIAHRRRRIGIHRPEIALAVDQRHAASTSPAPSARARRRSRCRRADGTYPSRRRRCAPTCDTAARRRSRSQTPNRGCGGEPASTRRARRAARARRSRSSHSRDSSTSSRRRSRSGYVGGSARMVSSVNLRCFRW